ncbi:MAG: uroporphyrinogen-III synthase [Caldilineaceae bacterium]|nr:uroporphyrinogen-III synthase [Caldilineaceae bacterium]
MTIQNLTGLRIANTRALRQAPILTQLLEAEGAQVLHYPTVEIEPCADSTDFDAALTDLARGQFDWLIVTSTNTVYILADRLRELGIGLERVARSNTRVAAVGSATATAIAQELNLVVDLMPDEYMAESLAASLQVGRGSRVLLPQSAIARPVLVKALRRAGAEVRAVAAYDTVVGHGGDDLPRHFWQGDVDVVLFTSASTVHNFVSRLKAESGDAGMLCDVTVACIGPMTAEAARRHDLPVQIVAKHRTVEGLVQSLKSYFARRR